ncbi:hypothetical protein Pmani_021462 [Petrolisthes manimaculis]|uniref:Uncharacterized protein n=1 Tax=Petrolisthes manimaculis TaxID=1843537 RepID=A0AAE1U5G0_9EUCA|nr:hypothetical protein Pmani_021462 [Petrolisthes manimaculis]
MLPRIKSLNRFSGRFLGRLLLVIIATGILTAQIYIILGTKGSGDPLPLSPRQVQQFLMNKMYELKPRTQEHELPNTIMDLKEEDLSHDTVKESEMKSYQLPVSHRSQLTVVCVLLLLVVTQITTALVYWDDNDENTNLSMISDATHILTEG